MTRDTALRRAERRRSPRYHFQAPLEIEWGSARLRARTRDISENGMFIESEDLLWVGAGFRARLATERPVWLDCSVKRVEPGRGMGVSIAVSQNQPQAHYQDLLSQLAASSSPPYTNGDETLP
ncbi:MAG TPA: PilZ domain-containing protein [Candidatus Acidoferrum sp.]